MSATDHGAGSPTEGPENNGTPPAGTDLPGAVSPDAERDEPAAAPGFGDSRPADRPGPVEQPGPVSSEPAGPWAQAPRTGPQDPAQSTTPDLGPAYPGEHTGWSAPDQSAAPQGPQRSFIPNRPARAATFGSGPQEPHTTQQYPQQGPPPNDTPFNAYSAGGGGFGAPPAPPHGGFPQGHFPSGPTGPEPRPQKPWSRNRLLVAAGATALVTSLIVGPAAAVITTQVLTGNSPISSLDGSPSTSVSSGDVSKVANQTLPSVVSINAGEGSGSGVVISSDGQILTNNHVIAGADNNLVVQFNDGTQAKASVLGTDPVSDLAVLKAEGVSGLTPASFGDSDKVEVGAEVVAIGSPLGLSGTVTSGVVSALNRPVNTGSAEQDQGQPGEGFPFGPPGQGQEQEQESQQPSTSTVIDAIQTDAPINPGNSGGPLMNLNGEIIGINTAIASNSVGASGQAGSIGLGFAIPINQAKPIIQELIENGEATYATIGATITGASNDAAGAEIVEVGQDGAAAKAGLKAGDVVTALGDRTVTDPNVLIAAIRSHRPGDTVTITYQRGGNTGEAEVTLSGQSAESIGG
ncbi:S1C family serine protease [Nocardiopsis ansamitocini]|uniref:PDZ domain-containing protein n=1 Tax=Nocardiopsis ansamitocini TaxID=1670832 RepID=A0A9W6UGJ2_9ACTN|nr:trypsin-like peptidase domain-containing protein [Nocardiopsis ansamitocini]GLU47581.1 hypothetical protein Nans01_19320 [Nocardiopsis ansamitocini]